MPLDDFGATYADAAAAEKLWKEEWVACVDLWSHEICWFQKPEGKP
jgi:hypothetical protein